ncbi:MAG: hypothetical protein IPO09_08535 [Anaeromyxobacter sp.]|nr:hypothetical protein [Anaeromyxobacter sp.]MBL0277712.1 hypothetical protein [Anaeromyxobacter sp.]
MEAFLRRAGEVLDQLGGISIESLTRRGDELDLVVRVVEADARSQTWSLSLGSVREHRIELGWCDELALGDDHPLLWTHVDAQASLYFSKPAPNPTAAAGRIWDRHQRETGGWVPSHRFLNSEVPLVALLGWGAGLLATGPLRLLSAYGEELDALGISWSLAGQRPPMYWKPASEAFMAGGAWLIEDQRLLLLTLGQSYLVAARFSATER